MKLEDKGISRQGCNIRNETVPQNCTVECYIVSPFLKLKMLGVSSGGILVTIQEKNFFLIGRCFEGVPPPPKFEISYRGKFVGKVRYLLNETR